MLAEFFRAVQQSAMECNRAVVTRVEGEPEHVFYLLNPNGTVERMECEPAPQQARAESLHSLMAWTILGPAPEVWYDRTGIWGLPNAESRREHIHMPLELSPQFSLLSVMGRHGALDQRAFLRQLKIDLADCIEPGLIEQFRKVTFKQQVDQEQRVGQQKASIGKKIEAEINSDLSLPDYVTLSPQVFMGLENVEAVRCALEINIEQQKFQLIPLPLACENAIKRTMEWLDTRLEFLIAELNHGLESRTVVPIYYGRP